MDASEGACDYTKQIWSASDGCRRARKQPPSRILQQPSSDLAAHSCQVRTSSSCSISPGISARLASCFPTLPVNASSTPSAQLLPPLCVPFPFHLLSCSSRKKHSSLYDAALGRVHRTRSPPRPLSPRIDDLLRIQTATHASHQLIFRGFPDTHNTICAAS
ncbi:hypothetical protein BDW22DRAFT_518295 [Trametopsis cervina]|nr:hypothetical protein BDW22DRAFT_518295 [Trametopsis cervina]